MSNRDFLNSNFDPEVIRALSKKQQEFRETKINYLGALEIYKIKKDSGNQIEADEWLRKANTHWLKLTEILAKDWGYDLNTFRELWKIRNPNVFEVDLKIKNYSALIDGANFFDLFGSSSSKPNTSEPKSLWQSIVDFFS